MKDLSLSPVIYLLLTALDTTGCIMGDDSEVDVLVIGAGEVHHALIILGSFADAHVNEGISGIFAAKFWLDTHSNSRLTILDRDNCIGGTWNSRELHYVSFLQLH